MSYHPRIEARNMVNFKTTRCRNSELWFVDNPRLSEVILANAAKYQKNRKVTLYALAIEGNHIHLLSLFPECNRSDFMRDFNSSVTRSVARYVKHYPGGRLWAKRYSAEFVPDNDSIEKQFFYTVLQPVQDGLVEKISHYPGYNCFHDAIWGIKRKFKLVNWTKYNEAHRWNPDVHIKDYIEEYELEYSRLPGYERLSQKEYATLMMEKLEKHRQEIIAERLEKGLGFMGRAALLHIVPGSIPKHTKTSHFQSYRPRVLCVCTKLRRKVYDWYFAIYFAYKEASQRYRSGETLVTFPPGTYKPPNFTIQYGLEAEEVYA